MHLRYAGRQTGPGRSPISAPIPKRFVLLAAGGLAAADGADAPGVADTLSSPHRSRSASGCQSAGLKAGMPGL